MSSVLDSLTNHERDLRGLVPDFERGFRRFASAVRASGSPQLNVAAGHVVGSKGKGSVAHILSSLIRTVLTGPVGLYTSPHLISIRERIRLDDASIPGRELERLARSVLRDAPGLSWFECLTLCAFRFFSDKKAAFAVYEAGLGGRLDATNVVKPRFVVLTPIEREHEDVLGPGLANIAREKLAVIKPGVPVFMFRQTRLVERMAEAVCRKNGCRLYKEGQDWYVRIVESSVDGIRFVFHDRLTGESRQVSSPMPSPVQARNIGLGIFLVGKMFPGFSWIRAESALASLTVPGRFQILSRSPLRVFDPCHTPSSFRRFIEAWKRLVPSPRSDLVIFLMKDKKTSAIIRLARKAGFRRIFWADLRHPRAGDPIEIDPKMRILDRESFREFWLKVPRAVAAVGSFYLAGWLQGIGRTGINTRRSASRKRPSSGR